MKKCFVCNRDTQDRWPVVDCVLGLTFCDSCHQDAVERVKTGPDALVSWLRAIAEAREAHFADQPDEKALALQEVKRRLERLQHRFPSGEDYKIEHNLIEEALTYLKDATN